jgi:3-hydroxyisobutyrate dehydrogenase-like beta-hydroxyacid dehydrogenase
VQIHDVNPLATAPLVAQGAMAQPTAEGLARAARVVFLVVVDAQQLTQALWGSGGLALGLRPDDLVVLCPTIGPAETEAVAGRLLTEHKVLVLDAPLSGGPQRAASGTMSLMVAGSDAAVDRARAVLKVLSDKVFFVGPRVGDGARTKLVNNLLAGIQLVGAAEVLALAQRMGLDASRTLEVIESSSGQSWIGSDRMRRALAGDTAPRAHMSLLRKDTHLAVAAALAVDWAGPRGPHACAVFDAACQGGLADADDSALLMWLSRHRP